MTEWTLEAGQPALADWQQAQNRAIKSATALTKLYQTQKADPLYRDAVLALYSPKSIVVGEGGQIWLEDDEGQAIAVEERPFLLSWLKHRSRSVAGFFGEVAYQPGQGQLYFRPWSFFRLLAASQA